jgi:hypothetical protein
VETRKITLEVRNDGKSAASGVVGLYPREGCPVDVEAVPYKLAPGEELVAVVGCIDPDRDIQIEARSSLAGVRPSRAR